MARGPTAPTMKKSRVNRLLLSFAGATAAAVIGTAGIAAAETPAATVTIPNKAACVNYKLYGFKNHGQCVSAYEHALVHGNGNGQGSGYGGYGGNMTNTANTAVTVNVNGNRNVVDVALSNIF